MIDPSQNKVTTANSGPVSDDGLHPQLNFPRMKTDDELNVFEIPKQHDGLHPQQNVPRMKNDDELNAFEILKQQKYTQKMFDKNILSFQLSHLMPWFDFQLRDKYMTRARRANIQNEDNDIEKRLNSISIPWNMRLHSPMLRG